MNRKIWFQGELKLLQSLDSTVHLLNSTVDSSYTQRNDIDHFHSRSLYVHIRPCERISTSSAKQTSPVKGEGAQTANKMKAYIRVIISAPMSLRYAISLSCEILPRVKFSPPRSLHPAMVLNQLSHLFVI